MNKKRSETTSSRVAKIASGLLRSKNTGARVKSVAGSALTQKAGRKKGG